ncbi:MAG: hypothetical protein U0133_04020 [Gemmatimonadales bacterium]
MSFALLLIASLSTPAPAPAPPVLLRRPHDEVAVKVTIDSAKKVVRVKAGPFHLPAMPHMDDHGMMDMGSGAMTPVYHFTWPVEGWLRGFDSGVEDSLGNKLPKKLMHHMIGVNYSRRQALYPAAERLFGAGAETADATIPATIGVPMKPGMDLGFYIMWHNEGEKDLDGIYMTIDLKYSPKNINPRPVEVLPLYMDVNLTVGGSNVYDVPPGKSEKSWEFTFPMDGRLLGYGGHLHDYGQGVKLVDLSNNKVIAQVKAETAKDGTVTGVSRSLPGVSGEGIRLRAGRKYRITAVYNNTTGKVLHNGAMAHITGIFAPDKPSEWPAINESDPEYQKDLASLEEMGQGDDMEGMEHMDHNAEPPHEHNH